MPKTTTNEANQRPVQLVSTTATDKWGAGQNGGMLAQRFVCGPGPRLARNGPEPAESVIRRDHRRPYPNIPKSAYVPLHIHRFPCTETAYRNWETHQERNPSYELRLFGEAPFRRITTTRSSFERAAR